MPNLDALCQAALDRPIKSWGDVGVLAEVVKSRDADKDHFAFDDTGEALRVLYDPALHRVDECCRTFRSGSAGGFMRNAGSQQVLI